MFNPNNALIMQSNVGQTFRFAKRVLVCRAKALPYKDLIKFVHYLGSKF